MADQALPGRLRRFMLESHAVRGHHVRLGAAWEDLRAVHAYPPAVEQLLGEAVTAVVLLAATLKFSGKLTLQFSGHGQVSLLVAQCTDDFCVRAVAQHTDDVPPLADFVTLVGDGRVVVTIEGGDQGARYQGIVPLNPAGIAASLEDYFASSEQLPTRLRLFAQGGSAGGLLLQRLPEPARGEAAGAIEQAVWERLQAGLQKLDSASLVQPLEDLLPGICGEYDSRMFAASPVRFRCGCSARRVGALLQSLGADEVRDLLREQGHVEITCEFCRKPYRFDAVDIEQLLAVGQSIAADHKLN